MRKDLSYRLLFAFTFILSLMILSLATAYAFFSYTKDGEKQVTVNATNAVKMHYIEGTNQIDISSGLPMDDVRGKAQEDYFEFTITGETSTFEVPYIVAARVSTTDTNKIPEEYISVYLTEVNNNVESEILFTTYDEIDKIFKNNYVEEKLYNTVVPVNTSNYEKTFRLRMWINTEADYTPTEENGVQTYPMEGKEFALTVNVYTEAEAYAGACTPATVGSTYCFDTQCFDVISSNCNETVLFAENGINSFGDATYVEPTGIQDEDGNYDYNETFFTNAYDHPDNSYGTYWKDNVGEGKDYIGDYDANTQTPYPYVVDATHMTGTLVVPYNDYYEAYWCDEYSLGCIPTVLNAYLNKLKTNYNLSSSTQIRLLTKEELDSIESSINLCGSRGYYSSFWTGSAASDETIFGYECEYGTGSIKTINYDSRGVIRPVIVMPTRDLPASAQYTYSPTDKIITNSAQQLAHEFNLNYDAMDVDYNIIEGKISEQYPDNKRIYFYLNTPMTTSSEKNQHSIKIYNYIKDNIADDGKLYRVDEGQLVEITSSYAVGAYNAVVKINGNLYDVAINYHTWESIRNRSFFTMVLFIDPNTELD